MFCSCFPPKIGFFSWQSNDLIYISDGKSQFPIHSLEPRWLGVQWLEQVLCWFFPVLILKIRDREYSLRFFWTFHFHSSWREKEGQLCRNNSDCNWLHKDLKVIFAMCVHTQVQSSLMLKKKVFPLRFNLIMIMFNILKPKTTKLQFSSFLIMNS